MASGARLGIRTPNLLIRSEMLYPIELSMHFLRRCKGWEQPRKGCKYTMKYFRLQTMFNKIALVAQVLAKLLLVCFP